MIDVYQKITDTITAKLSSGEIPWKKPWHGGPPRNYVSGKAYRGMNTLLLADSGFSSSYWLTFKQCADNGGKVKKGAKSTAVIFWKLNEYAAEKSDGSKELKRFPLLRYYNVFNFDQCEGLKPKEDARPLDFNPIDAAEKLVSGYRGPDIREKELRAYYSPALDIVNMPPRASFKSTEGFYATLFHELTHSTGHAKRLNREGINEAHFFGDEIYSKEELVAEFGAAFLCGIAGIAPAVIDNSAGYIQSWLKALKNDKKLLVIAASQAQRAADYITGATIGAPAVTDPEAVAV